MIPLYMNLAPKISVCQFKISPDKNKNIEKAGKYIIEAVLNKSNIIVLPECFVCEYDVTIFEENSECITPIITESSPAANMLLNCSKKFPDVYIVGGSIIEKEYEPDTSFKLYNTCLIFHGGKLLSKYRKNNLYKIQMKEHSFSEGDILTAGHEPTIFETEFGKIGVGICYDIRFPELAKYYQENGCQIIIYPGSFNTITGPKHWKVLQQVRALDNQLFIISCSSACSKGSRYESHGKSYIISPWGKVVVETELDMEQTISAFLNLEHILSIRKALPILS